MTDADGPADGDPAAPQPADFARMLELADLMTPQLIRVVVTLGVPELVEAGVTDIDTIAERCGADRDSLRSALAVLAERGLFTYAEATVGLTGAGRALLHPHARRAFDLGSAEAQIDAAYRGLLSTVRTGAPCYAEVHGHGFWDHLAAEPALGASFDSYLADHAVWAGAVAELDVWEGVSHFVDVGGGTGAAIVDILGVHPALRASLVELPASIERATDRLADAGLSDRVTLVTGSFFDPLPAASPDDGTAGATAYLLAHILHDWPDAEAEQILRVVRAAQPTKVLVVDQVLDDDHPTFVQAWSDLRMRALFGGAERTTAQWQELARRSGFTLQRTLSWGSFGSVLELRPDA